MQKQLEQHVSETAAVVSDWKKSVGDISTQLNIASVAFMRAKKAREAHALKAAMGEPAAIEAIKHARSDQLTSEATIGDLKISLPEAEAQLAIAERASASARHDLAEFNAIVLKRKRIEIAGELDKVVADFARIYGEYNDLGAAIVNMDVLPRTMHGTSNYEDAIGARRVRASLPKFFWKIFPGSLHDEMKTENLATTEARFWNLPEPEKSRAA
jgi:hypothetical protein